MVYITGDTHGDFERFERFCDLVKPTAEDCVVILGDVGLNYSGDKTDLHRKELVQSFGFTTLCIHGNHEQRPIHVEGYQEQDYCGGKVWVQPQFPSIFFAMDGEVFRLNGLDCITIGGAYSVDKYYRLIRGYHWFEDEQPSPKIKSKVEANLAKRDHQIDVVLSHTCPLRYEPTEVFLSGIDQSMVDKSTEEWLGDIERNLRYQKWYCGHYHTSKKIDKMQFMFHEIERLGLLFCLYGNFVIFCF